MLEEHIILFQRFVPETAAPYCAELLDYFGFEFKIKKSRKTKLGDYRYDPGSKLHTITINNDLNKYAFLLTYLHEVAHLVTYKEFKRKAAPHGKEWKANFRKVVRPVLNQKVFPENVLIALKDYFKNPKAASCSDPTLYQVLQQFDGKEQFTLSSIDIGESFLFQGKEYIKLEKKRTRSVCRHVKSGRKYTIAEIAPVEKTA